MHDFWQLSKYMIAYRWRLVSAVIFALLAAGSMGVGLAGMAPVLGIILSGDSKEPSDLPAIVTRLNVKIGGLIPPEFIESLPTGRYPAVLWVIISLGVLTVIGATANFLHAYLSLTVVGTAVADIREKLFRHVLRLPLRTVLAEGPSPLLRRVLYDTSLLAAGFNAILGKSLAQFSKGIAAIVVAFLTDWKLAGAAVITTPALYTVIRRTGKMIRRGSRSGLVAMGGMVQAANEATAHLRVVKASTAEERELERFTRANREMLRLDFRVRTAKALGSPLVEAMVIFALGALSLVAAKAIIDQKLDPANFITTLASLGIAGAALKPLTGIFHDLQQSAAGAGQIADLFRMPTETAGEENLPAIERHKESIVFEHVSVTYPKNSVRAVDDVSLTIHHGETVAFVGPNGCGKTTLLSLVPRLLEIDAPTPTTGDNGHANGTAVGAPRRGRLLIDGRDITSVSRYSLRRQMSVVTQETVLFKGTIRANIAYGSPDATQEQIAAAARMARAEEFILAKPGGYDSEVGEHGSGLSGGQRQRIAIARAILRNPAILILDEATSMIDADSEARIADALAEFSKGRTCLIVAHRLSTVIHADRIVVMNAGRIVDVGRHSELLGRCDTYKLIAANQLYKEEPPASSLA